MLLRAKQIAQLTQISNSILTKKSSALRSRRFFAHFFPDRILCEQGGIKVRYQKHKVSKSSVIKRIKITLLLGFVIFIAICIRIRPMLKEMTAVQAAYISNKAIDEAAAEVLARNDIEYDDLISINLLEDGTVASMTSDIQEMNKFKTELSKAIQEKILEYQDREVSIPLGTLTGIDLLSGRGPRIRMKIELYGNVLANLESKFDDAGINQTHHQIICNVNVSVSAVLPGCSSYTTVNNSFAVSETVLLGDVPESYTNVDAVDDLYDDINNFLDN